MTGANSGLGLVTARELARAGARVVLASRSAEKGRDAAARIAAAGAGRGSFSSAILDLADLESVREFAATAPDRVDLLINNAGVMAAPRRVTRGRLREPVRAPTTSATSRSPGCCSGRLLAAPAPRVVTVSSTMHRGRDDRLRRPAGRAQVQPLARVQPVEARQPDVLLRAPAPRGARPDTALLSMAAHPGYAATNLQAAGDRPLLRAVVHGDRQQAVRPERGDGRAADAVRGDGPRSARRHVRRAGRAQRAARISEGCGRRRQGVRRGRRGVGCGRCPRQLTGVHYEFDAHGVAV